MQVSRFPLDVREISAILSRTALTTSRLVFPPDRTKSTRWGPRLAAAIALLVLMGVVTGVLAGGYHEAQRRGAADEFSKGEAALNAGRAVDALDHYRAAIALARDDKNYRRALALALLQLRRTAEAETHLAQLLESDPVDGEANLLLARLAASPAQRADGARWASGRRSDVVDAEAYYQRAIYGRWPVDAAARRLAARFELIEWLTQMGAQTQARAELLRLQADLPDVPFLQRELAARLLVLGQPAQAASILGRELDRRPADVSVAADLARAEMAAGRFVEARAAARRALALDPDDGRTRERFDLINGALALDPTQRGLSAAARFSRSQRLLAMARADFDACLGEQAQGQAVSPDVPALLATARRLLDDERATAETSAATSEPTPPASVQGRTDARLAAAEALWSARVARCGASNEALAWIFDRLLR